MLLAQTRAQGRCGLETSSPQRRRDAFIPQAPLHVPSRSPFALPRLPFRAPGHLPRPWQPFHTPGRQKMRQVGGYSGTRRVDKRNVSSPTGVLSREQGVYSAIRGLGPYLAIFLRVTRPTQPKSMDLILDSPSRHAVPPPNGYRQTDENRSPPPYALARG